MKILMFLVLTVTLSILFIGCNKDESVKDLIYEGNFNFSNTAYQVFENASNDKTFTNDIDSSKYKFLSCVIGGLGIGQYNFNNLVSNRKSLSVSDTEYYKKKYAVMLAFCAKKATSKECMLFDSISWEEYPMKGLVLSKNSHGCYFGYLNLLLSMLRYTELRYPIKHRLVINAHYTKLNHLISAKLLKDLYNSKIGVTQTYPSQAFPTDAAAAIGSLGLYYKAYGRSYPDSFKVIMKDFEKYAIDKNTDLLNYYLDYNTGESDGTIRGSGAAVAMYFLSFADIEMSKRLYNGICSNLKTSVMTYTGIREFLPDGEEDPLLSNGADTGPIVKGIGTTSTGFTIAGSILFNDKKTYKELIRTAWKVGRPVIFQSKLKFNAGNMENAFMLAILTAREIPFN